jgi:hypothetical protein
MKLSGTFEILITSPKSKAGMRYAHKGVIKKSATIINIDPKIFVLGSSS